MNEMKASGVGLHASDVGRFLDGDGDEHPARSMRVIYPNPTLQTWMVLRPVL